MASLHVCGQHMLWPAYFIIIDNGVRGPEVEEDTVTLGCCDVTEVSDDTEGDSWPLLHVGKDGDGFRAAVQPTHLISYFAVLFWFDDQ